MKRAKMKSRRQNSDFICRAERMRFGSRTVGKMQLPFPSSDFRGEVVLGSCRKRGLRRERVETEIGRSGSVGYASED